MNHANVFSFLGNDLCIDFVNTRKNRKGQRIELLHGIGDVMAWFKEAGVVFEDDWSGVWASWSTHEAGPQIAGSIIHFRNELEDNLQRAIDGQGMSSAFLDLVNEWLLDYPKWEQLIMTDQHDARLVRRRIIRPDAGPEQMKGWIADMTADFLSRSDSVSVKKCENPKCILFFYDTSKNRSRRWCSMKTCGNRLKAAAYYQKKANEKTPNNQEQKGKSE